MTTFSGANLLLDRCESGLTRVILVIAIAALLSIVGLVFTSVILRYVFNIALIFSYDVSTILFAWLIFLGLAVAERDGAHMGIDIADRLPAKVKTAMMFVRYILLLAAAIYMCRIGMALFQRTGTQIPSLRISARWLYAALPIGFALLSCSYAVRLVQLLTSRKRSDPC
ncbi:MAG: TRAP transporter small permease [Alphaproteobacteria bacterium]|jgi:TRAP-type transport system small permease protein|nr:TRAP transporter small permease [Alphaproteobacteria bacterium]MBU1551622.1 TRAP transporter small permease [Alphaproteobacteria bacterium]MBU2337357.1 TRAP transporter small permease [Alphaproteobacteria bacterium]MBU2388100.1 TRAP transporter small permease [Alphaproteobacteria bacterium]